MYTVLPYAMRALITPANTPTSFEHMLSALESILPCQRMLKPVERALLIARPGFDVPPSLEQQIRNAEQDFSEELQGFSSLFSASIEDEDDEVIDQTYLELSDLPLDYAKQFEWLFRTRDALIVLDDFNRRFSCTIDIPCSCSVLCGFAYYADAHVFQKTLGNFSCKGVNPLLFNVLNCGDLLGGDLKNGPRGQAAESHALRDWLLWLMSYRSALGMGLKDNELESFEIMAHNAGIEYIARYWLRENILCKNRYSMPNSKETA